MIEGEQTEKDSRCNEDPLVNLPKICKLPVKMYFYNTITGECFPRLLGVCGPNPELFDTEEECEDTCYTKEQLEKVQRMRTFFEDIKANNYTSLEEHH